MILKIALSIVLVGDGSRLPIPSETESALRRSQGLRGATLASSRLYEGPLLPPSPHKRKMQLNLKGGFERTFFLKGSAALCSPRKQGFLQSLKRSVGQGKDGEKCRRGLFISRYNRSEARVSSLSPLHIQISTFQRRCKFLSSKKGRTSGLNP